MTEIRIPVPGARAAGTDMELVFDSDDVSGVSTPADVHELAPTEDGHARRAIGIHHLELTFKPGKRALWSEVGG